MKRVVAVLVSVVLVLHCPLRLRKERYPPRQSEQVSEVIVIDAAKREQLGLFPGIETFKEAQFFVTGGYGYEVKIVTAAEGLVAYNDGPDAAVILNDYIQNYEKIECDRASFESKWGVVDYDTLGLPITKSQVARAFSSERALACGFAGGCLGAGLFGLTAGILQANAADEYDEYRGLKIATAAVGGGTIGGLLAGCLTGVGIYQHDKKKAVEIIKERRKPRIVE